MIGDFILWIYKQIKQTFCIHKYKIHGIAGGDYIWWECEKCGRLRDMPI
jgi:hypothetical protein